MRHYSVGRKLIHLLKVCAMLALAQSGNMVSASPFFDGTTGDVWVVAPATGQVVGYDFGSWVDEFAPAGSMRINLAGNEFALVNAVSGSSIAPTPGQPALSLVDVGAAALPGTFDAKRPGLLIRPVDGTYDGTIAVRLAVSSALIEDGGVVLRWQINAGSEQSITLSAADLDGSDVDEGYFSHIVYLVRDGDYQVTAEISVNNTSGERAEARYTLASSDPDGFRRDADGDGIPDLVEAELGLDPFADDWQALDADGWSRFDKWLRARCLDENLVPVETGDDCLDDDGLPIDTDGDGWADFDERLRRTNPNDPEPLLTPEGEETLDSEAFRLRVLRFKDFPAAGRLYEPERLIIGGQLPTLAPEPWLDVTAASAAGTTAYLLSTLLTEDEIQAARLDPATVAPRLQRLKAHTHLTEGQLPHLRLGAGDSMILAASQFVRHAEGDARRIFKVWLPRWADVTPEMFRDVAGPGTWETAAEWRREFIRFLGARLTVTEAVNPDTISTAVISILEGALGEEARIAGLQPIVVFAHTGLPVASDLIQGVEAALEDLAENGADLDAAHEAITADIVAGGSLQAVATWLTPWIETPPASARSDVYIATQFQRSFDISCYLTEEERNRLQADNEAWSAFLKRCGEPLDLTKLQSLLDEDSRRVYLARLLVLPGAAAALQGNNTLADALFDSDGDGLTNGVELSVLLDRVSLPWLADTDGDGVLDGTDPCPVDSLDSCTGTPVRPEVSLDPAFNVFEPASGIGYALIGIELEREYSEPVTVFYETFIDTGDTATPGQDFVAVQGSVTIAPGQRISLVRVEILSDRELDDNESFSLRITGIEGAVFTGSNTVGIIIKDTPPMDGCSAGCFVGGEVQGLAEANVLRLLLNDGVDEVSLAGPDVFAFATPLQDGSAFTVSIGSQPVSPLQDCFVQNGSGTINGADYVDVLVLCFAAVTLQATAGDGEVALSWNASDFAGATFNFCRAEEEILDFDNCLMYGGGEYLPDNVSPSSQVGLANGQTYWFMLEAQHSAGPVSYSDAVSVMPAAAPEPSISRVNDSGQLLCYDELTATMANCSSEVTGDGSPLPGQDGRFGRDAQWLGGRLEKRGGGSGGFDFTPLDLAGNPIPIVGGAPESPPACVRDNVTGLTWEVKTAENLNTRMSRSASFSYAGSMSSASLCGFTDWRVPLRRELLSIVDSGRRGPAIDVRFFPNTVGAEYWSNDSYRPNTSNAWYVNFLIGTTGYNTNGTSYRVRVVRGDKLPTADYLDNGDGTVTDQVTGLVWDKCPLGQSWDEGSNLCSSLVDAEITSWEDALQRVSEINTAGHRGYTDWRLPSRVELESIVNLLAPAPGISEAAIDNAVFPNTGAVGYWTSTVLSRANTVEVGSRAFEAMRVGFNDGGMNFSTFNYGDRIRLVRSGDNFDALR